MKKTLCFALLLSLLAQAKPYSNPANHFRADFEGKVVYDFNNSSDHGKLHEFKAGPSGRQGSYVVVLEKPYSRQNLLKWMLSQEPGMLESELKDSRRQGFPALTWSGLDPTGTPVSVMFTGTRQRSYIVMCCDFDLAKQRRFLNSFHILP